MFYSKNEPHGILNRIYRIQRICRFNRKRNIWARTDPGFPTPGVRITVVYTNSLKSRLSRRLIVNQGMRRSEKIIVDFACFGSFTLFLAKSEVRFVKIGIIKPRKNDSQLILTTFANFSKIMFLTPGSLSSAQKQTAPGEREREREKRR